MTTLSIREWPEDEFLVSRDTWTDLIGRSRANPLFMGWEWQATWWRTHGVPMPAKLKIIAVYAGSQLVGLAPFYQHAVRWREILPIVRMECLGHAWRRHGPDFGEYLDFIVDRNHEAQVLPLLFNHIVRDPSWGEIVISNSPCSGIAVDSFGRALRERGCFVRTADALPSYPLTLDSTFEAYLKRLDGGVRRKLWAGRKKLPGLEVRSFGTDEIGAGFDKLNEFHAARWNSQHYVGPRRTFHEALARLLADRGGLSMSAMYVGGELISMLYDLRAGGVEHNIQCGYTGSDRYKGSIGYVHLGFGIESAIAAGQKTYNFLAGGGKQRDYKQDFEATREWICTLHGVRHWMLKAIFRMRSLTTREEEVTTEA